MKHILLTIAMSFVFSMGSFAQNIEEEVGFIYTKAKYLLKTDRLEEAVGELNKVIKQKANFEDALLLRAEAKYVLGAYAGVKKDLNEYISENGITARVARLYGMTDYQGGNKEAAFNSVNMALYEIKDDAKLYELRAELYEDQNEMEKACKDYYKASQLGSGVAKRKYSSLCGDYVQTKRPRKLPRQPTNDQESRNDEDTRSDRSEREVERDDPNDGPGNTPGKSPSSEVERDVEPEDDTQNDDDFYEEEAVEEEDNTINEVVVDQDLTLLIQGGGLGSRDVMRQPNILIISDDSGDVSIDVCVSEGGRITSAVFDNANSTIKKQSLVSLAIRKAKEFWFERQEGDERCGKIIFRIKGA